MQQISLFDDERITFPATHEDILKLHATYVNEGEADADAFTWSDIKNGRSYFFYGKKAFELINEPSGKVKLRIQQDNGKPVTLTADSPDLLSHIQALKEMKHKIFRNLGTESFACCNDFIRCSDAQKCLHSEDRYYNGCIYRKNLENGKIFYGKNKNI